MRILCSMPGRHGDLLWSLPTARAIAETYDTPVDFLLSGKYASLRDLIAAQPYIDEVLVDETWVVQETAPMTPREPDLSTRSREQFDRIFHLGYEGWPTPDLARDIYNRANRLNTLVNLDLTRPWITVLDFERPYFATPSNKAFQLERISVGFSDEHFELKYGLAKLVEESDHSFCLRYACHSPRWDDEAGEGLCSWLEAADLIAQSQIFFGCCSALHVLAVGLGIPAILCEPNPHRWNDVFYPLGKTGPQVTLVLGGDGQPTFDARHCADALCGRLQEPVR